MRAYYAFVKSRVTAMQGDNRRAVELCCSAYQTIPPDNLALQNEVSITLGYLYFLNGDFLNADRILQQTIQTGFTAKAINNPVAAYALLARMQIYQGRLRAAQDLLQIAHQLIHTAQGQYQGVTGLLEVETAALLREWNDLDAALVHLKRGLELLPWWGKTDDLCLAYSTLACIQLARGSQAEAINAIEKAAQLLRNCGVFSEARSVVETTQVKVWIEQEDWPSVDRWIAECEHRFLLRDSFHYEDELAHFTQARVFIAQKKPDQAILLLSSLEESARSADRLGRLIEILLLKSVALQAAGDSTQADADLTESLSLAEPEGYVRIFLDEGRPVQARLAQWLEQADASRLRDYAAHLLAQFDADLQVVDDVRVNISAAGRPDKPEFYPNRDLLVENLSPRELEVLQQIALGKTNRAIARQLYVAAGTIKAHTSSIYRKLDVTNRTEAVARARQLGILT
jgi:LuxR family maltose regulon positive regulatory protein